MTVPLLSFNSPGSSHAVPRRGVRVNGVEIPAADIAWEVQNHPADLPAEAWRSAASALVVRELLLQESARRGLAAEPQRDAEGRTETHEEAAIRSLVDEEIRLPEPTEEECRRVYSLKAEHFRSADLYEVRHILLGCGDEKERSRRWESAREIISRLQKSPEEFPRLAAELSACPSAVHGGKLGQIGPGQTVEEFEVALATAPVGEVAPDPVETRYGWHVVQVDRALPGSTLPFEIVKNRIASWLQSRTRHAAVRQFISLLASRATIEGVSMDGLGEANVHGGR